MQHKNTFILGMLTVASPCLLVVSPMLSSTPNHSQLKQRFVSRSKVYITLKPQRFFIIGCTTCSLEISLPSHCVDGGWVCGRSAHPAVAAQAGLKGQCSVSRLSVWRSREPCSPPNANTCPNLNLYPLATHTSPARQNGLQATGRR